MQVLTVLKSACKYVLVLVVIIVAAMGILLAKDRTLQTTTNTQLQVESNNLNLTILSAPTPSCMGLHIYTSLPPKCRASDGSLVEFDGFSSNITMPPGPK